MLERLESEALDKYYERYKRSVQMTAGCRFEASRRLKAKDTASATTIAILTLYPIILSVADLVPAFKSSNYSQYIPFVATTASIVILVLSLLEYAKQYSVRAAQMQQCAQELNEIYYDLDYMLASKSINEEKFRNIKARYDKIIDKYPENHSQSDFHFYRATHVKSVKEKGISGYFYIAWHKTWHLIDLWAIYVGLLIAPALIIKLSK